MKTIYRPEENRIDENGFEVPEIGVKDQTDEERSTQIDRHTDSKTVRLAGTQTGKSGKLDKGERTY